MGQWLLTRVCNEPTALSNSIELVRACKWRTSIRSRRRRRHRIVYAAVVRKRCLSACGEIGWLPWLSAFEHQSIGRSASIGGR